MKVEVLVKLKGSTTWRKGTVFDDTVSPIPGDILKEIENGARTVRVMAESPFAVTETDDEYPEPTELFGKEVETTNEAIWKPLPEVENYPPEAESLPDPELESEIDTILELEVLLKNIPLKQVAELLRVPYQRVVLWRSGRSTPPDDAVTLIHEEFEKVR